MNVALTTALSLAMSTDAFVVALGKGASAQNLGLRQTLRMGLVFGLTGCVTLLVGRACGHVAAPYVELWNHWIAFLMLSFLGLRMMLSGVQHKAETELAAGDESFWGLFLAGAGTSVDAMAIGASLTMVDSDFYFILMAAGITTFVLVIVGMMVGRVAGAALGAKAEIFGGLVLVVGAGNLL